MVVKHTVVLVNCFCCHLCLFIDFHILHSGGGEYVCLLEGQLVCVTYEYEQLVSIIIIIGYHEWWRWRRWCWRRAVRQRV